MFMPVGTQATVKTQSPEELKEMGFRNHPVKTPIISGCVLEMNLLHAQVVSTSSWIGTSQSWRIVVVSRFYSLADSRNITEEGVTFKNHLNGSKMFLSPEKAISIQNNLGSDIMMSFDECPQFYQPYDYVKKSIERTSRWAERGLKAHRRPHDQGLLGLCRGQDLKTCVVSQLTTLSAWISQATLSVAWQWERLMKRWTQF